MARMPDPSPDKTAEAQGWYAREGWRTLHFFDAGFHRSACRRTWWVGESEELTDWGKRCERCSFRVYGERT